MIALLKNFRVALFLFLLTCSVLLVSFSGLKFGIDFMGGTQFQVQLARPASTSLEMQQVVNVLSKRLDWTGLKDTRVSSWGEKIVVVQIAETDPETIEFIESSLRRQGRFEATLDGNLLFSGDEIAHVFKDPARGYAIMEVEGALEWTVPFMLKQEAAERFTRMAFHRCRIVAAAPGGENVYDCDKTYFFIDRPLNSVIILPPHLFESDRALFLQGNRLANIPQESSIDELLLNAGIPFMVVEESFSDAQLSELSALVQSNDTAIVPRGLDPKLLQDLNSLGFSVKVLPLSEEGVPWLWSASNAKQIISLSEDVTNLAPFVADPKDAKVFSNLVIRGFSESREEALKELSNLAILLESGSLPVPVATISKETISPSLGRAFLFTAALMGLVALLAVALVVFIRYRVLALIVPIILTAIGELFLILGFASLVKWNLDLAAVAGIIAAIGTGVDHQIIIADELMRGERLGAGSFVNRIKRAFFIIVASASTVIATMAPIILFGLGLGKLMGFAITTVLGALIGVIITRPAFAEIVKFVLSRAKEGKQ